MIHSINERFIVDKKGNPTAVILPIEEYKKLLSALEETGAYGDAKNVFKKENLDALLEAVNLRKLPDLDGK